MYIQIDSFCRPLLAVALLFRHVGCAPLLRCLLSELLSFFHTIFIPDDSRAASPELTYEIVGLSDVVVPHGHLQSLFGEVCIFYVVTELLQKIDSKQNKKKTKQKKSYIQEQLQLYVTLGSCSSVGRTVSIPTSSGLRVVGKKLKPQLLLMAVPFVIIVKIFLSVFHIY